MYTFYYRFKKRIKRQIKNLYYRSPDKKRILLLIKKLKPIETQFELIRLGGEGDGGYLVPDDLGEIEACYSPGVGNSVSFEKDCADRGMKIYLADASVDSPLNGHPNFNFIKKFLGNRNNKEFITLESWISSTNTSNNLDLLLQMDIEGYEYEVLLSSSENLLKRFRIIIIEFHDLHKLQEKEYYRYAKKAFDKLTKNHYCLHIHPNNSNSIKIVNGIEIPPVAEFTFIRKDRVNTITENTDFPHPLDEDNLDVPPIVLPKIWFN